MKCPACGKSLWFRLPECPHCHASLGGGERNGRPWSVSLPCWVFFALACLNLAMILLADWTPGNEGWRESFRVKAPFAFYMRYVMPLLMVALVLFMLNGRNWARWVFVVWFGNAFFWQVLRNPKMAWPQAVLFAVCVVLWFLPRSNQFFTQRAIARPAEAGGALASTPAGSGGGPEQPLLK